MDPTRKTDCSPSTGCSRSHQGSTSCCSCSRREKAGSGRCHYYYYHQYRSPSTSRTTSSCCCNGGWYLYRSWTPCPPCYRCCGETSAKAEIQHAEDGRRDSQAHNGLAGKTDSLYEQGWREENDSGSHCCGYGSSRCWRCPRWCTAHRCRSRERGAHGCCSDDPRGNGGRGS